VKGGAWGEDKPPMIIKAKQHISIFLEILDKVFGIVFHRSNARLNARLYINIILRIDQLLFLNLLMKPFGGTFRFFCVKQPCQSYHHKNYERKLLTHEQYINNIMAPRLAAAWSSRVHGTSTSNNAMILAQLLITEAGIATAEAYQLKASLELANLKREMATLRRMLELKSASSPALSSPNIGIPFNITRRNNDASGQGLTPSSIFEK
jgi:hypothetical protein